MNEYNFDLEITRNIKMFESAFDDVEIRRYDDMTGQVKDRIKVNFIYGLKGRTLLDLKGLPDTIKFPAMAINMTGMAQDRERMKNKLEPIIYSQPDGGYVNLYAIPFNINIEMSIMTVIQEDMNQIIQNFAVHSKPYIIFSWKEPKSGREVRTEVFWDGNINLTPPNSENLPPTAKFRYLATTNFTIKTWIYRTSIEPVKPICFIPNDIIITNNFYCDYDTLTAETKDNDQDNYLISGRPNIKYVSPYYITEGTTPTIKIQGSGFTNTFALFVSGNTDLYPKQTQYVPGSAQNVNGIYNGVLVDKFNINSFNELTFTLPAPSGSGFIDIIAVNPCGYGQLTVDANRCNREENPYPPTMPEHYNWCVAQFPYLNGLIVNHNLNLPTEIICDADVIYFDPEYVDKDSIIQQIRNLMELGNISAEELI